MTLSILAPNVEVPNSIFVVLIHNPFSVLYADRLQYYLPLLTHLALFLLENSNCNLKRRGTINHNLNNPPQSLNGNNRRGADETQIPLNECKNKNQPAIQTAAINTSKST